MNRSEHQRYERIYLTGLRGTGKTSVGRAISDRFGFDFVDLDVLIESSAGKTIREIFEESGEQGFRDWESQCLLSVSGSSEDAADQSTKPCRVVSLGGGAILRETNRGVIAATGVCVWLTASASTLARRMAGDETTGQRRPALTDLSAIEEVEKLMRDRAPMYEDAADFVVETEGKSIDEVTKAVCQRLTLGDA